MLGSISAKATITSVDLNLDISPYTDMISAQEIQSIPLIDRVGAFSSLIISSILFSSLFILISIWERRVSKVSSSNSNISFEVSIIFVTNS